MWNAKTRGGGGGRGVWVSFLWQSKRKEGHTCFQKLQWFTAGWLTLWITFFLFPHFLAPSPYSNPNAFSGLIGVLLMDLSWKQSSKRGDQIQVPGWSGINTSNPHGSTGRCLSLVRQPDWKSRGVTDGCKAFYFITTHFLWPWTVCSHSPTGLHQECFFPHSCSSSHLQGCGLSGSSKQPSLVILFIYLFISFCVYITFHHVEMT